MRFARGSNPVIPRHQLRRANAGSEPMVWRHTQRSAARLPARDLRSAYSASRSPTTSSRSAIGTIARRINPIGRGNLEPRILHCRNEYPGSLVRSICFGGSASHACCKATGMARALWSGSLSFGLVNIPVEIHTAVRDKGPHFRMLRKKDRSRIQFQRIAEKDGEVVEWDDIVKGYEFAKGQFVVLTPEDFERAALEKDRVIDIQDFVQADAVDDRYFDKPYYLLPGKGGDKAYALLREAIRESGRIGVAKFVLRSKQRLAAIEAIGDALVLSTMRFRDELAKLEEYDFPAGRGVEKKQLQLAQRLIEEFASEWDPERYTDDYRQNIMKVVEAKREKTKPDLQPEADPQSAQVIDLMERLRKSLGTKRAYTAKAAKPSRSSKAGGRKRARKTAKTKRKAA